MSNEIEAKHGKGVGGGPISESRASSANLATEHLLPGAKRLLPGKRLSSRRFLSSPGDSVFKCRAANPEDVGRLLLRMYAERIEIVLMRDHVEVTITQPFMYGALGAPLDLGIVRVIMAESVFVYENERARIMLETVQPAHLYTGEPMRGLKVDAAAESRLNRLRDAQ